MNWKNTRTLTYMMDEVKANYVKWIQKVCVNGIFKPDISEQSLSLLKKSKEKPLIFVQVFS